MNKDWKKEAWQLHYGYHQTMNQLEALIREAIPETEQTKKQKETILKLISNMHGNYDTLVMWVEKLNDETLRLHGALEEARRPKFLGQPETPQIPQFNPDDLMKHSWKGKKIAEGEYAKGSLAWGWDWKANFKPDTIKALEKGSVTIDKYEFTMTDKIVQAKKKAVT